MNEHSKYRLKVAAPSNPFAGFSHVVLAGALVLSSGFPSHAGANDNGTVAKATAGRQVGKASWYGPGFHGKKTASGQIFNQHRLTAAHPRLPLGSRAKVTNLRNGKTVEVTINDRGPHRGGRIIDLSRAAAKRLDMGGIARVSIVALP